MENNVQRIRELIKLINKADEDYYMKDAPTMSDKEYDALVEELTKLELVTGIVFANSPSRKVGGKNSPAFTEVEHVKPMLSAQKTKDRGKFFEFASGGDMMLSWKMDGLTLVLKYENGNLVQALTRGEEGLRGEDVTRTVRFLRNVPQTVPCTDTFHVRGEGVLSWKDFDIITRKDKESHPRNVAAGTVRTIVPDRGKLVHMDFFAFELIGGDKSLKTKQDQFIFLMKQGFEVVGHSLFKWKKDMGKQDFLKKLEEFDATGYAYPVDGIIAEYNNLALGRRLGETKHHENRLMALKWEDEEMETTFRGVTLAVTKDGTITMTAEFDPINLGGSRVNRADLHSLSSFEKLKLGIGDKIVVYKANMIIPQISRNLTQSGNYVLGMTCPCCQSRLIVQENSNGTKKLLCGNPSCIAKNAQKIARYCDTPAMNIPGLSISVLEDLMANGLVHQLKDIYHLDKIRKWIDRTRLSEQRLTEIIDSVEKSRVCSLSSFLVAVDIPYVTKRYADHIDEYFSGSFDKFETAIREKFNFARIDDITPQISTEIYRWYENPEERKYWEPILEEISFKGGKNGLVGEKGNPFKNARMMVTGTVAGMNVATMKSVLSASGAIVTDEAKDDVNFIVVGDNPDPLKLFAAITNGVTILTANQFTQMLGQVNA